MNTEAVPTAIPAFLASHFWSGKPINLSSKDDPNPPLEGILLDGSFADPPSYNPPDRNQVAWRTTSARTRLSTNNITVYQHINYKDGSSTVRLYSFDGTFSYKNGAFVSGTVNNLYYGSSSNGGAANAQPKAGFQTLATVKSGSGIGVTPATLFDLVSNYSKYPIDTATVFKDATGEPNSTPFIYFWDPSKPWYQRTQPKDYGDAIANYSNLKTGAGFPSVFYTSNTAIQDDPWTKLGLSTTSSYGSLDTGSDTIDLSGRLIDESGNALLLKGIDYKSYSNGGDGPVPGATCEVQAFINGRIVSLYYYVDDRRTPVVDRFFGDALGPVAAEVTAPNQLTVVFRTLGSAYVSGNYGWITIGNFDLSTGDLTSYYNFGAQRFDPISPKGPRPWGPYLSDKNNDPSKPTYVCNYDLRAPSHPVNKTYLDAVKRFSNVLSPPSYSISSVVNNRPVTSLNEGSTVIFQVSTTNIATGTPLNYKISGDVNAADFAPGASMSGSGKIDDNGKLNISLQLVNDKKTEGAETIKFQLFNSNAVQLGDTVSLTINDTSTAPLPTFTITPSKAALNEGDTLTTTITTSNISPRVLYWKVSGPEITANDVSGNLLTGSLNATDGGTYKLTHMLKNDYLTEGSEDLTISLFTDQAFQTQPLATSSKITINDTSTDTLTSSQSTILPPGQANLTLTGTGNINGTGNDMNNNITGNNGNNILTGSKGKDILTGLSGQDTFSLPSLSDSLIAAYDVITDFTIGQDKIKGPTSYVGKVTKDPFIVVDMKAATIQAKLTANAFKANTAAILSSGQQTFLILNDSNAGFDPLKDSIIEITGYKSTGGLGIANIGSSFL